MRHEEEVLGGVGVSGGGGGVTERAEGAEHVLNRSNAGRLWGAGRAGVFAGGAAVQRASRTGARRIDIGYRREFGHRGTGDGQDGGCAHLSVEKRQPLSPDVARARLWPHPLSLPTYLGRAR